MVRPEPGSVVWIEFPFADGEHSKARPALFLRHCGPRSALFCMITTKPNPSRLEMQIPESEQKRVLMKNPLSVLRLDTLFTLDISVAESPTGRFSSWFTAEVKTAIKDWL